MTASQRPWRRAVRRNFLTGLIVIAPVGLTAWVLWSIFRYLDGLLGDPIQGLVGFPIPGLGFLLLFLVLVVVGWTVRRAAGRQLLHWWNDALVRFPLTGRIYNAVSQVIQSFLGSQRRAFSRTVLVPFAGESSWIIGFVTNDASPLMSSVIGEPCLHVFVPTTPNPTTGFLFILPAHKVKELPMSVEDAMKLILSGGAVTPEEPTMIARRGLDLERLLRDTLS
jgi:uncharacterized membrane protein